MGNDLVPVPPPELISEVDLAVARGDIDSDQGNAILDLIPFGGIFGSFVGGVRDQVTSSIDDVTGGVAGLLEEIIAAITSGYSDAVGAVGALGESLYTDITTYISDEYQALQDTLATATDAVLDEAIAAVSNMGDIVDGLETGIVDAVTGVVSGVTTAVTTAQDTILAVVDPVLTGIQETADAIIDQATGFATALRDTVPELATTIGGALGGVGDVIGDAVRGAFVDFIDATGLGGLKDVLAAVARIPELVNPMDAFSPDLTEKMGPGVFREYSKVAPQMITLMIPFIGTLANLVFGGPADRVRQASMGDANAGMLSVTDMTSLEQRGWAEPLQVQDIAYRSGLSALELSQAYHLTRQRHGTMDIIDFWRRELMNPPTTDASLRDLGWSETNIDLIKEAAYPPPGVGDLITMAVREVFDEEIAKDFGQFEDAPADYLMWAKRIGLDEYWAMNYWAAHWTLPSVQQGYEMLHRGVIDDDQLEKLFVALDIMPGWRADLKAISYSPFTRVDLRRMRALGVIDRPGVKLGYKDIGYDEEKAELLTEFTERYVESQIKIVKTKERDLSKADVIGMFNDGVVGAVETEEYLIRLGYSKDEATVLIRREELQEELRERREEIAAIIDQAKIKALTFEQAQDRLSALDLSTLEMRKAVSALTRAIAARTRTPSKADLDNWKELTLLTSDEYEIELQALGYPDKYIALYLEAMEMEADEDILAAETRAAGKREPRVVSKGQLDQLYIGQIIEEEEYTTGLEALGYRNGDIVNFLVAANLKLDEKLAAERDRVARGEEAPRTERVPSRVILGKMYLKGLIDIAAYEEGLTRLGFNAENVALLRQLIIDKQTEAVEEVV